MARKTKDGYAVNTPLKDRKTFVKEVKHDVINQITIPNGNQGGKHSPIVGDNGLMLQAGDNTRALAIIMKFNALPDIDLFNAEQVSNRVAEYFTICAENDFKPTTSSFSACLGLDRKTCWAIANDYFESSRYAVYQNLPTLVRTTIKKGYGAMEQLWEYYMQNGKINPVSGIFLAKNNYGYQDKVDYVVQAKATLDEDELSSKYIELKGDEI